MFIGTHHHTIDIKGRAIVPAKFREQLGAVFVLTKGLDGCLYGYSKEEWKNFEEDLKELSKASMGDEGGRRFIRFFIGHAVECEIDKQGRFLIPQSLREYAGIDKEVVTMGSLEKIEIWGRSRWDDYEAENKDSKMIEESFAKLFK